MTWHALWTWPFVAELAARIGEVRAAIDAAKAVARGTGNNDHRGCGYGGYGDGGGGGGGDVYCVCSRGNDSQLAERYLRVMGLPVGPSHRPLQLDLNSVSGLVSNMWYRIAFNSSELSILTIPDRLAEIPTASLSLGK